MITTKNGLFLHIPKTAGIWVIDVLKPITDDHLFHAVPQEKPSKPNVYAFVRNPWDWYHSFYHFQKNGSETFGAEFDLTALLTELPNGDTFEDFVKMANNPTKEYKQKTYNKQRLQKLMNVDPHLDHVDMYIHSTWLESDVGFYQHVCNLYTKYITRLCTFENIRQDLASCLKECEEYTPELQDRIDNTRPINVTYNPSNYRTHYNSDLVEIVANSNKQIINQYGYTFE